MNASSTSGKFAIVKIEGRQYRLTPGMTFSVSSCLAKDGADKGSTVSFKEVLIAGEGENVKIGAPFLSGAEVQAKILSCGRSKKVEVFKKKNKGYTKTQGHRQDTTTLQVENINA